MRETKEDWLELGRDLTSRGLPAPRLVVADGAAGLPSAIEEIWPRADRQRCARSRLRNLQAKLPKSQHDRIRVNYWSALNDATGVKDGKLRLQVVISELEHAGYQAAARCPHTTGHAGPHPAVRSAFPEATVRFGESLQAEVGPVGVRQGRSRGSRSLRFASIPCVRTPTVGRSAR